MLAAGVGFFIYLIYQFKHDDEFFPLMGMIYLAIPLILGSGYLIWKTIENYENSAAGRIRVPQSIFPYNFKSYRVVREVLITAGYKNIRCVALCDLKSSRAWRDEKVSSVTVDGQAIVSGKSYDRSSEIVILYHSSL